MIQSSLLKIFLDKPLKYSQDLRKFVPCDAIIVKPTIIYTLARLGNLASRGGTELPLSEM